MLNHKFKTRNPINISFFDSIVVFLFFYFILLFFISLVGWFNIWTIILLAVLSWLIIKYFFVVTKPKFDKRLFCLIILVVIILAGFMMFRGRLIGDATTFNMIYGRQLALTNTMPAYSFQIGSYFHSRSPFTTLAIGIIYTFFGNRDICITLIPYFFTILTIIVMFLWGQTKGIDKKYLYFIPLIFVATPLAIRYTWDMYTETILLFFFTTFFYYFEKNLKEIKFANLFLMLAVLCLALLGKVYSLILIFPLLYLMTKKGFWHQKGHYLLLLITPYVLWLVRTYILYHNPVTPALPTLFNDYFAQALNWSDEGIKTIGQRLNHLVINLPIMLKKIHYILPVIFIAIYGFYKNKKIYYFWLLLFFLCFIVFVMPGTSFDKHFIHFAGLILVYFFIGLEKLKSKFLTMVYFLFSWRLLLDVKIPISTSSFISPIEVKLDFILPVINFINNNFWLISIVLMLYFLLFIKNRQLWPYLIFIQLAVYIIRESSIQISWLIVWLPILITLLIFLAWPYLEKLKFHHLTKLSYAYLIILTLGLSLSLTIPYAIAYHEFQFPNQYFLNNNLPVGQKIIELEGNNKDFYIASDYDHYLTWPFYFKITGELGENNFQVQTGYAYRQDMIPQEVYRMLKRSNIKYIIRFSEATKLWDHFFKKIENQPDYFELIWVGKTHTDTLIRLWLVKE